MKFFAISQFIVILIHMIHPLNVEMLIFNNEYFSYWDKQFLFYRIMYRAWLHMLHFKVLAKCKHGWTLQFRSHESGPDSQEMAFKIVESQRIISVGIFNLLPGF